MSEGPARRESAIVKSVIDYLRAHGAFAEKIHGDATQSALLDIIACYKGYFLHFEVKQKGKWMTRRQKYIVAKVIEAGGIACRIDSVEGVAEILKEIDHTTL